MVLPLYLAQTPLEMAGNPLPDKFAYLACHFSSGGKGLSNLPEIPLPDAILILDDSTPMDGHDPELIVKQLIKMVQRCQCEALLLDFQRPENGEQQALAKALSHALPCPVGVSEVYAQGLSCPVFLPPVPPDKPLAEYLSPWQGREIWLETAMDGIVLNLTESGCTVEPLWDFPADGQMDEQLHCHYSIKNAPDSVTFRLWRTRSNLSALLSDAQAHGVTKAIGLWQELG